MMKINKTVKLILVSLALVVMGQVGAHTVHAAGYEIVGQEKYDNPQAYRNVTDKDDYSRYRGSYEDTIWNKEHTERIARLSDYPHTTWYVLSKLTLENNNDQSEYYEIRSSNKKHHGYVLIDAIAKKDKLPATILYDPANLWQKTVGEDDFYSVRYIKRNKIDNAANKAVVNLFPGTVNTNQVQLAADFAEQDARYAAITDQQYPLAKNGLLGKENLNQVITITLDEQYLGPDDALTDFLKQEISTKLKAMGKNFSDFSGYHIGAYVRPIVKDSSDKRYNGKAYIYLVPPTVKLPKVYSVVYDPFNPVIVAHSTAHDNTKLNKAVDKLFTKTKTHKQVQLAAELLSEPYDAGGNENDGQEFLSDILGAKNAKKVHKFNLKVSTKKDHLTQAKEVKLIKAALNKKLKAKKKSLNSFKGAYVGSSVGPLQHNSTGKNSILVTVAVVKSKTKLPKIGNYTFDINKDNLM